MADKIAKRGVSIFIDGKEVKNSVAGITSEMRKLQAEQKKMTIGADNYVAHGKKIEYLRSLHNEHIQNQKKIAQEYGNMSKAADKSTKSTEGGLSRMANGFNKYFAIFTAGLAAITGLTLGLKKFMDMRNEVEDSKANLKALTGLGDQDIQWLRDYAKELSTTTTEAGIRITASAKEIMDGFTTIGSKRPELLKNKEAMAAVTKEALTLAAAGKMDVATAFDVVTASMNQFNLKANQTKRIINVIAAGSLEGSAEADSLAGSLKNVGTVANGSNMTLEDTIAMLEVLASKQLMGEEAGTKLRGALLKMKDAGVGYVSGAFNVRDAIIEINEQMAKKTSAAQRDALLQKVFGAENITAGQILLENVDAYDKLRVAVTGTNVAYNQAIIQTGTVSARLAQAQNRFSELGMELVQNLNPAMLKATDFGNMFLKMLVKLPSFLQENKVGVIAFVVGLTAYLTAVNMANIATKAKLVLAGLEKVADYAKIAALRIKILLTGQATIAELRLVAAQRALNASMMVNIYAAAAIAIAAIGVGIYKLATRTTDAQKAMRDFNREAQAQTTELNNIFEAYKKANPGTAERARLLQIIKEKYGPYIKNLIDEKGNITDIEKAQKQANTALRQSIALKIKNQYIEQYTSKEIEQQADLMTDIRNRIADSKGSTLADVIIGEVGSIMQKNINDPLKTGSKEVFNLLKKYDLMSGVFDRREFGEMVNSLASSYYRIGIKTKEFNSIFKSLIGDVNTVADAAADGGGGTSTNNTTTTTTNTITNSDVPTKPAEENVKNMKKLFSDLTDAAVNANEVIIQSVNEQLEKQEKQLAQRKQNEANYLQDQLFLAEGNLQQQFDIEKQMRDAQMASELSVTELTEQQKQAIKDKYRKLDEKADGNLLYAKFQKLNEYASAAQGIFSGLNNFVSALGDKELADFEKNNKGKANFEEEFAKKKAKVEYDNAVRAKELGVLSTIISTTSAVMAALAPPPVGLGPVAGIPFAIAAGAEGALQLATIAATPLPNYWTGGFSGPGGKYEPKGIVHGNEFIANSDALSNPNLMPVFNAIDSAQRMGTVRNLKPKDLKSALRQDSYDDGSSIRRGASGSSGRNSDVYVAGSISKMEKTIDRLSSILDNGIEAHSVISGKNGSYEQTQKYERYIKNASR